MNNGQDAMVSTLQCKAFGSFVPFIPYPAPSPVQSHFLSLLPLDCKERGLNQSSKL
jgi:hypothetical protein